MRRVEAELDKLDAEGLPHSERRRAARATERTHHPASTKEPAWVEGMSPAGRCNLWIKYLCEHFPLCAKAAVRLISMHVTSAAAERNWSIWGQVYADLRRNRLSVEKANMLVSIMAHYRNTKKDHGKHSLAFVEADDEE